MKNSNDTIGNRTRDLLTCSAVPQPTALRRAPLNFLNTPKNCQYSPYEHLCSYGGIPPVFFILKEWMEMSG